MENLFEFIFEKKIITTEERDPEKPRKCPLQVSDVITVNNWEGIRSDKV